jgi:hypothetical protein
MATSSGPAAARRSAFPGRRRGGDPDMSPAPAAGARMFNDVPGVAGSIKYWRSLAGSRPVRHVLGSVLHAESRVGARRRRLEHRGARPAHGLWSTTSRRWTSPPSPARGPLNSLRPSLVRRSRCRPARAQMGTGPRAWSRGRWHADRPMGLRSSITRRVGVHDGRGFSAGSRSSSSFVRSSPQTAAPRCPRSMRPPAHHGRLRPRQRGRRCRRHQPRGTLSAIASGP